MILLIILFIFIVTYLIQDKCFKNKKKYENKYIEYYQKIKIPLFISCIFGIILDLNNKSNKSDNYELFLSQPKF